MRVELARLRPPLGMYAVTGNHEVASTNDPFSRPVVIDDWSPAEVDLLRDRSVKLTHSGVTIEVAGSDAEAWLGEGGKPAETLFTDSSAFRILLAHFPDIAAADPGGDMLAGALGAPARRPDLYPDDTRQTPAFTQPVGV